MSYPITHGSKYDKALDVREIAKLIRADIRAAAGPIPHRLPEGFRAGVRISRYSMGRSIDVTIKAAPGVTVRNPARVEFEGRGGNGVMPPEARYIHTEEARAVLEAVKAIIDAYNFDGSDVQSDYFHVNVADGDSEAGPT